jgi:GntR family transcriptional regulator
MLPFPIELTPGESPYRQIVYAATRAVVSGELLPGAPFPSVRVLSQSLKLNPNTAQKAIAELVRDGLLEVKPGVGTVVADWGPTSAAERTALLTDDVERLIVEARRLGITRRDLVKGIEASWAVLFEDDLSAADTPPDSDAPSGKGSDSRTDASADSASRRSA